MDLIINKPTLLEFEFQKVKKSSLDLIKKDRENLFNICFEKWRKIVYSGHPYAFNTIGNANDIEKISYKDILYEFKNFKNREMFMISNNFEINGENLGTFNQNFYKRKKYPNNYDLDPGNRCLCAFHVGFRCVIIFLLCSVEARCFAASNRRSSQ